jgi:catechol 2,3-dioxygenase-like lactoylglutathione lyase family enzyme
MTQYLAAVTVVVADYDEAIAFYVGKLGFSPYSPDDGGI